MTSVLTLLPALAGALAQQGPQPPAVANVFDILPLPHLSAPAPQLTPPPWATMLSRPDMVEGQADLLRVCDDPDPQFPSDWIAEALSRWNEDAVDEERLFVYPVDRAVHVRGNPEDVATVRRQLRALTETLNRPLQVEVALWRAAAGPAAPTVLSPDGYAGFADSHELLWRGRATTHSARPIGLESSRWTDYVCDIDVEIAQKVSAMDPAVDAFFEGLQVLVSPHALVTDDGFVVHTQFAWAEPDRTVASTSTDIPKSAHIDTPLVRSLCAAFSGRIPDGGALCATMRGTAATGPSAALTVRVRGAAPRPQTELPCGIFPVSALVSDALLDRLLFRDVNAGGFDPRCRELQTEDEFVSHSVVDDSDLMELALASLSAEQQDSYEFSYTGGFLMVRGSGDTVARVAKTLTGLEQLLLRPVSINQQVRLADGSLLNELTLPTLPGRHVTAVRRWETNVIRELDAEVAQDARVTDPIVGTVQCGSWLRALVALVDDEAHLQLLSYCSDCELEQNRSMLPDGALNLPSIAAQRVAHDSVEASGVPISHGDGPVIRRDGKPLHTEIVTTVRY